jgi:hypothetical protein
VTVIDIGWIAAVLVFTGVTVHLLDRCWPHQYRREHNDVAGYIFTTVGVLYAVLLAFVVVAVWGNINTAQGTTYSEANQLANVYWISRSLPLPEGATIEKLTLTYAHTVIGDEWSLMADRQSSPAATALLYQIRSDVFNFHPKNEQQTVLYEQAVTNVNGLAEARRDRLDALNDIIPAVLWIALIVGAAVTVAFCFLFGLGNKFAHAGMVAVLAGMIALSLLLIKDMEYPFGHNALVSPAAFQVFLDRLPPPR